MNPRALLRAAFGLTLMGALVVALHPRHLPGSTALTDPAAEGAELVTFGLRCVATTLAGYVALVLLALLLASLRLLPTAVGQLVDRWTGHGVAAAVRQFLGASALAVGMIPIAPALASAATPPVLAPVDPPPDARAGPVAMPEPPVLEHSQQAEHPPAVEPATITVAPGDSFWSLAEGVVAHALDRDPTEAEVVPAWSALIAANRDRLVDPANPDLLLPGQVLRLPSRPR
jgi:LysM domain